MKEKMNEKREYEEVRKIYKSLGEVWLKVYELEMEAYTEEFRADMARLNDEINNAQIACHKYLKSN